MTHKEAIVSPKEKLSEIRKLAEKIESSSNFVKEMNKDQKKLYLNIVKGLQEDTNNELTDTEYESIAKMSYFCDMFEQLFKNRGLENTDSDILDLYRKMKTQITIFMKDYREGKRTTPPSIKVIQNYLIKISKSEDALDDMRFEPPDDAEIIDVELVDDAATVRPAKTTEDEKDNKDIQDADSV